MRRLLALLLFGLAVGAGLALALRVTRRAPELPDPPAVAMRIRDVAQLETLEVSLYKKVSFAPEPAPADSLWGDVAGWLRHTFRTPRGKAIVFAVARLGLDLSKLDGSSVSVRGREAFVVLPPFRATVELRPDDTEIVGSTLDSAETARLFELAKVAFERQVEADAALQARARASAERQVAALLTTLGFAAVHFVDALPGPSST
ncbi:MAG TPA: DUF4230 domain-containing protein [Anaeromyxobacter sp.]